MTPSTIPPIGIRIHPSGSKYDRKVTPAWIAKRLRRHAGAQQRVTARSTAKA